MFDPKLLTLPNALQMMLAKLDELTLAVKDLKNQTPPERPQDRVDMISLSNVGNTQQRQIPVDAAITGLLITNDTTGQGTLVLGSRRMPIWITAYTPVFLEFGESNRIDAKGSTIMWANPGNSGNYDVHIFWHAKKGNMSGAVTRS